MNDWKTKRLRRHLLTSATQYETFASCPRKWWLEKVRGLVVPPSKHQVFGTVLHSVCERYLKADDLGRDKNGRPVELYPEGWHIARDRFDGRIEGEASLIEQDSIKKLVAAAIESGVLERRINREVEYGFRKQVILLPCPDCTDGVREIDTEDAYKCPTCDGDGRGTNVEITGFIDVLYPDTVEDHKTTGNLRYAKSPAALANNMQMLIYGGILLSMYSVEEIPDTITFRHNVFCRDPDDLRVRKVEARVTASAIFDHNAAIRDLSEKMDNWRRNANEWHEVPEPRDSNACNAYGGCPFRTICSGKESCEGYEKRLDRYLAAKYTTATVSSNSNNSSKPTGTKGSIAMDFAAKLAQKAAVKKAAETATPPAINPSPAQAAPAATAQAAPPPVETTPQQAPSATPSQDGLTPPPWAALSCTACGGLGFNTKGSPCRICDATAGKRGVKNSNAYKIEAAGDGTVIWINREDDADAGVSPMSLTVNNTVKAEEKVAQDVAKPKRGRPAKAAEPQPQEEPAAAAPQQEAPATEAAATEDESEDGNGDGRGRPKKSFILCVNCVPFKGISRKGSGRYVHNLNDVLHDVGEEMAKQNGVESFYALDPFRRRDEIGKVGRQLAEQFANDIVIVTGLSSGQGDLKALYDAIRPYAGMEIVAVQ